MTSITKRRELVNISCHSPKNEVADSHSGHQGIEKWSVTLID